MTPKYDINVKKHTATTPTDWKNELQQTIDGYDSKPAKGLVHGLQKDAIQNGWGHRISEKGTGWRFIFDLFRVNNKTYLALTDEGTTGLTGPNLSTDEINEKTEDMPYEYKLARFTAMKYSGGDGNAPGLYGRGKMLFHAASKNKTVIFESLTRNEGYRVNMRQLLSLDLRVFKKAKEGDEGKEAFEEWTEGLEPLIKIGTRIIIVDPMLEVVDAINSGKFMEYIEETWWRIIEKGAEICIRINGKEKYAQVPKSYSEIPKVDANGWRVWDISKSIKIFDDYKIKNLKLIVSPNELNEDLRGVHLYRKGMKVGQFSLNISQKIDRKYFGYVELDRSSEKIAEEIEDLEHYGWKKTNRNEYRLLKGAVVIEHDKFMESIGLGKKLDAEEKRIKDALDRTSSELNQIFAELGVESIGEGINYKPVVVMWKGITFPNKNSNMVSEGDEIKDIKFVIKNNSGQKRKFNILLNVIFENRELLKLFDSNVSVGASSQEMFGPFGFKIKPPLIKHEKMYIQLLVTSLNSNKSIIKKITFYYERKQDARPDLGFTITPITIKFPRNGSKRVNTDEKITNIKYLIKNNTSYKGFIGLHIRTHNMEDENRPVIQTVLKQQEIEIDQFSEIEIDCPDIIFTKETYLTNLEKGLIELRASISASRDFERYEFADEVSHPSKITIYFNRDEEGISIFKEKHTMAEEGGPRSLAEQSQGNWMFSINRKHPCYENVKDNDELFDDYLGEEMIRQSLYVYMDTNKYSVVFTKDKSWFEDDERRNSEIFNEINISFDKLLAYRYRRQ